MFAIEFLRPWWFLGALPVAWILWQAWQAHRQQGAWHKVIAPPFRTLLLGNNQTNGLDGFGHIALMGLGGLWLLMLVALAGPTLKTVEIPAEKSQQGTVILLDLSLSMLADDVSPNRLTRVKFKLTDLLTLYPEQPTGLVVYAGSTHTLAPISEDNQTLLGLLPALDPTIMPSYGSDPLNGFKHAKALLNGAHVQQGHIIWITDDLEPEQIAPLSDWLNRQSFRVSVLAVGTDKGGAVNIPNFGLLKDAQNNVVLPPLAWTQLEQLAQNTQAKLTPLTLNDRDIQTLRPAHRAGTKPTDAAKDLDNKTVQHPLDEGSALLFLLIPLAALIYRRGWIFSLGLSLFLPIFGGLSLSALPNTAFAQTELPSFTEVFKSADQQAYQAWQKQNFEAAQAQFEHPQWRASSLYRLGQFEQAAKLFAQDSTAQGWFNQGNALAKAGQLDPAITAYQTSLSLQPNFKEAADNLALVEQLLKTQSQEQAADKPAPTPPSTAPEQKSEPTSEPTSKPTSEQQPEPKSNDAKDTDEKTVTKTMTQTQKIVRIKTMAMIRAKTQTRVMTTP
ncbi:VWA domain-containing protein [Thiomicrorhabdus aquaedulcis]|uniref:VWA domain-containing protein n=1 Tax=Thiomicrorhabdus aquaedulcis TaxID=2211106 RepID=UPI000FDB9EC8|nr:VWA domain-containing protein [Thiomicrorhabdus aquaedulcis]